MKKVQNLNIVEAVTSLYTDTNFYEVCMEKDDYKKMIACQLNIITLNKDILRTMKFNKYFKGEQLSKNNEYIRQYQYMVKQYEDLLENLLANPNL
jgi:hypothetical protein